jgi:hypothetical protein
MSNSGMQWNVILQRIVLLTAYLVLGIAGPWWIFLPMILVGLVWKQIGSEIIIITMILDMTSGGVLFALWYSIVALGLYIGTYTIRERLMR